MAGAVGMRKVVELNSSPDCSVLNPEYKEKLGALPKYSAVKGRRGIHS